MAESRWAQLTYSSFDTGLGTGGGWQVKQTTGGLSDAEADRIKARVVTNFESADALPQFPTPEDIAALPRRLAYLTLEGSESFAYWHAVPSGVDGTGRPGNVFTHVLLDREPTAQAPALRPLDLWRSDFWLSPFGPHEVVAAVLDEHPSLARGPLADSAAIIGFLLDPTVWRGATFAAFLDALIAARNGGPTVVLATESADSAALWVASALALMTPSTARSIGFSLFERAGGIEAVAARRSLVVGIPYADLDAARILPRVIVIDDRQSPAIGDLEGAPHQVGDAVVAVTPWSVMAQVALQEPELASRVLSRIDDLGQTITGPLDPAWPLAMVVALLPAELEEASQEAFRVLRDSSPSSLTEHPGLWRAASELAHAHLGTTTAEAWAQVEATSSDAGSVLHDLAVSVYRDRVLDDREWIRRPEAIPAAVSNSGSESDAFAVRLASEFDRLSGHTGIDPDSALHALRLADWVVRSALVSEQGRVDIALDRVLREVVAPVLLDPLEGPALAQRVGRVSEGVLSGFIRGQVEELLPPTPVGERIAPDVIRWLYPDPLISLLDVDGGLGPLALESVIQRAVSGDDSGRRYRAAAYLAILDREDEPSYRARHIAREDWSWEAADALAVLSEHPTALPTKSLLGLLSTAPWDSKLDELTREILRVAPGRADGDALRELALLRRTGSFVSSTGTPSSQDAALILSTLEAIVARGEKPPSSPEIDYAAFVSAFRLAVPQPRQFMMTTAFASYLIGASRSLSQSRLRAAAELFVSSGFAAEQDFPFLAAVSVRGADGSPMPVEGPWYVLSKIPVPQSEEDSRFVTMLAEALVPTLTQSVDDHLDRVSAAVEAEVARSEEGRQASKTVNEFERFAKPTWKHLRSLEESSPRGRGVRGLFGGPSSKETI